MSRIAIPIGLALMVAAAFGEASQCDFVNLDDDLYVTANPHVQAGLIWDTVAWAFSAFHSGHWHPLTWLSLAADVELFGVRPGPMHVVNVSLHALNTVLLFWVLRAATGATWRSAVVAALFGLHPLRVESVAWVTERKDVLSVLFWISAMGAYIYYTRRPTLARYAGLALLFVLGLLAKPMLVTLPLMLLLLDWWPLGRWDPGTDPRCGHAGPHTDTSPQRGRVGRPAATLLRRGNIRLLAEKVPLLALALAASMITTASQRAAGATVSLESLPAVQRIWNAGWGYVRYLGKTFWPTDLAVFYPLEHVPATLGATAVFGLALVTGSALRYGGARRPYLTVGWLWWLVTLLPVIGLVQVGGQAIADRFTYVPHIGLLVLMVWSAHDCVSGLRQGRIIAGVAAASAIAVCLVLTPMQVARWRDTPTLFRHALAVTTDNYIAHNNLGLALAAAGEYDAAARHYAEAVRINPTWPDGRNNLGTAYARRGEYVRARAEFQEALRRRPSFAKAANNVGTAYALEGNFAGAVEYYERAVALDPENFDARFGLADALERTGDLHGAARHYATLLRMRPASAQIAPRLRRVEAALDTPAPRE